jgi:RNA polymerase sigma-70 factor (ECF subfamily)
MASAREDWAAVLDSLLAGDRLAFVKLSRVVTGLLASWRAYDFRDDWDDLVQEVLMAAMDGMRKGRIREREATLGYIRAIARNQFNKRLARHLRQGETATEPWEEACEASDPEAEARADPDLVIEVRRALAHLPKGRADVLIGVYGYGRTYEQVAQDTGTPLGTVKRHLREGLAQLRKGLSGGYEFS